MNIKIYDIWYIYKKICVNSIEVKLFLLRYQAIYLLYLSVYSKWTDITIAVPFSERTPFKIFALSSDSMSQWWQNIIVTGEVVASEDYDISWNNHSKLKQPHITQDHSMLPKNHHSASRRPQHRRGGRASLLWVGDDFGKNHREVNCNLNHIKAGFLALTSSGSRESSKPSIKIDVNVVIQSSMDGKPSSGTSNLTETMMLSTC